MERPSDSRADDFAESSEESHLITMGETTQYTMQLSDGELEVDEEIESERSYTCSCGVSLSWSKEVYEHLEDVGKL